MGNMERYEWDDRLKIGVEAVDKAHAKLFRIIKKMIEVTQDEGTNPNTCREGVKYLEAYSMTHFSEEEEYMRSIRYKGYTRHKQIHDHFRDKTLIALKRELEQSGYSLPAVQHFLDVMNNWLSEHIMREDQAIVGRVVSKKNRALSDQLPIISKRVNHALQDVFQIEGKLVNPEYKGENIGHGFYCRQYYDMEGGIRLQLLVGVEELLLLRGVERIPGTKQMVQKGEVADEILLRVFRQLFGGLKKLFQIKQEYMLGADDLLSKDDFRIEFMKGYPCSLLFGTKAGNFIFCYRSWRMKSRKTEA